jgi:hypothetical protein
MREIKTIHSGRGGFIHRVIYTRELGNHMLIDSTTDCRLHPCGIPKPRWLICQMSHKNQNNIGCPYGDKCEVSLDGLLYNERKQNAIQELSRAKTEKTNKGA